MASHWKWMLFVAGTFFPVWILLFFYTQNAAYVRYDFIVFICGILILVSALVWGAAYAIFRSPTSSLSVCVIVWMAFYAGPQIVNYIHMYTSFRLQNAIFLFVGITALIAFLSARLLRNKGNGKVAFFFIVMIGVLLVINIFFSIRAAYAIHSGTKHAAEDFIKKEFAVEKTKFKLPNIY